MGYLEEVQAIVAAGNPAPPDPVDALRDQLTGQVNRLVDSKLDKDYIYDGVRWCMSPAEQANFQNINEFKDTLLAGVWTDATPTPGPGLVITAFNLTTKLPEPYTFTTKVSFETFYVGAAAVVYGILNVWRVKLQQIRDAADLAALQAIDVNTGWPV